jgi:hypothetical protein
MKRVIGLSLATVVATTAAQAGEIYGRLTERSRPIAEGTTVKATCPGFSAEVRTDRFGFYRLFIAPVGACDVVVTAGNQSSARFGIRSQRGSVRYDFELDRRTSPPRLVRR